MARGTLVFSLLFLALPLLGLLAAWFLGGGLWLTLVSLMVLLVGFTVAVAFFPSDA